MEYSVNFGTLPASVRQSDAHGAMRIAVLADLSGRANRGQLETGDALASRKPLRVDVDNLDELIERLDIQLHLPISDDGGSVRVPLTEMESFHPDELYTALPVFSKLAGLRAKLADSTTFPAASRAVAALLGTDAPTSEAIRTSKHSRSSAVPNAKLSDFASLVGRPASEAETPINNLIKGLIRPHVTAAADPQQADMVATVDVALSDTMRRVLHHPDFQALESAWRCVELLVRRLETDTQLQIVLYDITAEEIAADLSSHENLSDSGLYKLLVEQPQLDANQGSLSVLVGNYTFEQTPPHADLLGRMAKIAAAAQAPFVASMSPQCLKRHKPGDLPAVVTSSWDTLRGLPEASYLALTVPRFMLRWPFGKKTEPIDSFQFEEFTARSGIGGMLWGNSAFLAGLLLGQTFQQQGWKEMKLGSVLGVDDLPFYYYVDKDGDQVALPCTDRLLSESLAAHVKSQNFIPVLAMKGRPEVRLGGLVALSGDSMAGPWAQLPAGQPQATGTAAPAAASPAPAPAPATAAPESSADDDLDAMLADLEGAAPAPQPEATQPEETQPTASQPAAEDVDDLDAMLAALDADEPAAASSAPANEASPDDDLDALLADLGGDTAPAAPGSEEMDPDLADLLADL